MLSVESDGEVSDRASGRFIQRSASKELWLSVDEHGGTIFDDFESARVPNGFIKRAGPRIAFPATGLAKAQVGEGNLKPSFSTGSVAVETKYVVPGAVPLQYRAIRNATLVVRVFDYFSNQYTYSYKTGSGENGTFLIPCPITSNTERLDLELEYADGQMVFRSAGWNSGVLASLGAEDCSNEISSVTLIGQSDISHVWSQMQKAADMGHALLGQRRASVDVEIDMNAPISKFEQSLVAPHTDDRITIAGNAIPGAYGAFTQAHEFGHALHKRRLGGYQSGTCGSDGHSFASVEAYPCAYAEGFADYFAAITLPSEAPGFVSLIENRNDGSNTYFQYSVSARQELQIAALLFDLSDSSNETHDNVSFPFSFVSDLVRTCEVLTPLGNWDESGGDFLVYCLEQQIDPAITNGYFTGRPNLAFREAAVEPSSWCRGYVRRLWKWNFAGEVDVTVPCN